VYRFLDAHGQVLYVGRARDLRARLRSYFRTDRQRPAVEGALAALDRIEWDETGSELEAALEELRAIRELRPVANARLTRPDRYVYLRRRGDGLVCTSTPSALGPFRNRTRARLACRALDGATEDELAKPARALPRLHARLRDLSESRRFEDAARLRDRIEALEQLVRMLRRLERLRATRACVLVPARERGFVRAYFVAGGRIAATRMLPPGPGARIEIEAGLAAARESLEAAETEDSVVAPDALDELLLVGTFMRRPPPELRIAPLDADAIVRRAAALPVVSADQGRTPARAHAA
jgi:excinuclease UvrABC nuclease subunit